VTSPLEPAEITALASLPLRGTASLAELVVDAGLGPSDLQRALHLLQRRKLVLSPADTPREYGLTALGRSARRSLESARADSVSGPAITLDEQEAEELRAVKHQLDEQLDRRLGPVDPEIG
jgi:hypothetical protein